MIFFEKSLQTFPILAHILKANIFAQVFESFQRLWSVWQSFHFPTTKKLKLIIMIKRNERARERERKVSITYVIRFYLCMLFSFVSDLQT